MTNTPITNESEAMEVWHDAHDAAYYRGMIPDDQAAARVIATALEARDVEIAALRANWSERMAEHTRAVVRAAHAEERIAELEGALGTIESTADAALLGDKVAPEFAACFRGIRKTARAILTKGNTHD